MWVDMLIVLSYLGLVRFLFKWYSPTLIKDAQLTKRIQVFWKWLAVKKQSGLSTPFGTKWRKPSTGLNVYSSSCVKLMTSLALSFNEQIIQICIQETSCNLKLLSFWEKHIIVIIVPNFYRAISMDSPPSKGRHLSERTGLGERDTDESIPQGKERNLIGSYCSCPPNGLTYLGNLFLGKPTGSNW